MLNPNLSRVFIITILLLLCSGPAWARIWQVAKDDSAEFQVIQHAVDAASSGDTIQIGPGQYTEYTVEHSRRRAWYVGYDDMDLTIVGSTEGETIIGNEISPLPNNYDVFGIRSGVGSQASEFRNITFEVYGEHCITSSGSHLVVEDCKFVNSYSGVYARAPNGGYVRNCYFENIVSDGLLLNGSPDGVLIENCNFVDVGYGVSIYGISENIDVLDCTVTGGKSAFKFISGSSGSVRNCTATGQERYGVTIYQAGTVLVDNCRFTMDHERGVAYGLGIIADPGDVTVRRSVVTASGTNSVIGIRPPGFTLDIKGNHFIRANDEAFFVGALIRPGYTGPLVHVDLTGNYWGTTDTDVIDSGIVDLTDVEEPNYVIDYLPLLPGPVPTKRTTMGGAKALFR